MLATIESPTHDKAAVDRCGSALQTVLEGVGATVGTTHQADYGNHLRAEFGDPDATRILMLGHIDTVWDIGTIQRMPVRQDGDWLAGPGVFDMKSGIVCGILATMAAREVGHGANVVMLWTTDEEIGSPTSREMIEAEARQARAVLVLEPSLPGGAVKTSRRGCLLYNIELMGRAAHAGIEPEAGASAIHELTHQLSAILKLHAGAPGVTVNVGVVSGGTRSNVVAESARAQIDIRVTSLAEAQRVDAAMRSLSLVDPRTTLCISGGIDRPPFERNASVNWIFQLAKGVAHGLEFELEEGSTGGGSDGNFTAALGIPTLDGLGPEGRGAHAAHEAVDTRTLTTRAALIAGVIEAVSTVDR